MDMQTVIPAPGGAADALQTAGAPPSSESRKERGMKILVIDDSLSQRLFLKAALSKAGHEVTLAGDGHEGISKCAQIDPDIVLLDVVMPGIDGYETARVLRGTSDEWVPIIFLSGKIESADVEAGIDAGGDDYLTKPVDQAVLEAKIRSMSRIARMRRRLVDQGAELRSANAALLRLVDIDGLTGLANRRRLDQKLAEEVSRCARSKLPLSVVLLDIDHFKKFNDAHGHLGGDECLKQVARTLESGILRPADLVARYGGEEFCLVLPDTDEAGALTVAERLRANVAASVMELAGDCTAMVTASFGVCSRVPAGPGDAEGFLSCADGALYTAKESGRNRVCVAAKHG
jgi:diguanylate cyclase (GGDEF)-like protein